MKYLLIFFLVLGMLLVSGCQGESSVPSAPVLNSSAGIAPPSNISVTCDPPNPAIASPNILWPPNKQMIPVTFAFSGTLATGTKYDLTDEYGQITYHGTVPANATGITLNLEASREGSDKTGRYYTFTLTNGGGSSTTTVVCPHDKR
ncbi:MAG: hypothetical protein NTV54_15470 [Ignavibacteriales bacterium]|nr:hypothetical protein [Ignavibacteriales bacterium]